MREYRMYGFVPYNISEIQKGIQFGHAVVEYSNLYNSRDEYKKWSSVDKTFIILNGGTTNKGEIDGYPIGTLNRYMNEFIENDINIAFFHEPDLGDQLTSFVFLVDDRVYNREIVPDFIDWVLFNYSDYLDLTNSYLSTRDLANNIRNSDNEEDKAVYQEWLELIGGESNEWLREFLKNKKLA